MGSAHASPIQPSHTHPSCAAATAETFSSNAAAKKAALDGAKGGGALAAAAEGVGRTPPPPPRAGASLSSGWLGGADGAINTTTMPPQAPSPSLLWWPWLGGAGGPHQHNHHTSPPPLPTGQGGTPTSTKGDREIQHTMQRPNGLWGCFAARGHACDSWRMAAHSRAQIHAAHDSMAHEGKTAPASARGAMPPSRWRVAIQ